MSYDTGTNVELKQTNLVSGVAKNTFNTEVTINDVATMGAPFLIPAKWWQPNNSNNCVGKAFGIVARGIIGCTATPTFLPTIRLGASAGAITGPIVFQPTAAITMQSSVTNQLFEIFAEFWLKTVGGPGANSTGRGVGSITCSGFAATSQKTGLWGAGAAPGDVSGIDWSVDNYLNVNFTCNTSNAANAVQLHQLHLFGLN